MVNDDVFYCSSCYLQCYGYGSGVGSGYARIPNFLPDPESDQEKIISDPRAALIRNEFETKLL
jgi:hypothetical protein